jgi:hypothetical protein
MSTRSRRGFWRRRPLALRAGHAACALGLAVAACQGMDEQPEPSVVDAKQSLIRFQHADFDPDLAEYSVVRYRRTGNALHLARFYGVDGFAMLATYKTSPSYVMEERPLEAHVADMLTELDLDWGESGRTDSGFGTVPYRLFNVVDESLSCVGFGQTIGERTDDRGRKSDLVVGVFCHDDSRPMSVDSAEELISNVSLAGHR